MQTPRENGFDIGSRFQAAKSFYCPQILDEDEEPQCHPMIRTEHHLCIICIQHNQQLCHFPFIKYLYDWNCLNACVFSKDNACCLSQVLGLLPACLLSSFLCSLHFAVDKLKVQWEVNSIPLKKAASFLADDESL